MALIKEFLLGGQSWITAFHLIAVVSWFAALFYLNSGWFQVKLALVLLLIAYHYSCLYLLKQFRDDRNTRGHVFYRWFNEIPVLMLIGIVVMVIVRPF